MLRHIGDDAVSDIIATTLLLLATVIIGGATAIQLQQLSPERDPLLQLDVVLLARPNDAAVTALHTGGGTYDPQQLRALLTVNGTIAYDGPAGSPGLWALGDSLVIGPLGSPIPPNARVELSVVHREGGRLIASSETLAAPPRGADPGAPNGFTMSLRLAGGTSPVVLEPPAGVLVEATVNHTDGRKIVRYVYADLVGVDGIGWQLLTDDGTNGDHVAGDGTYSGVALVPTNVTSGVATINATAVDFYGASIQASANITVLSRNEITEQAANPTGSPAPGGSVCPPGNAEIRSIQYQVNNATLVPKLASHIRESDHVKAVVTLADGCSNVQVTLASYRVISPVFSWVNASSDVLHGSVTTTISSGQASLEIDVPPCVFGIDIARGSVIATPGPASSDNYYSRQARLLDSDRGGVTSCA